MKSIALLSIEENSLVKRHQFQQHDDNVFTLLMKLQAGNNEFSIETKDTESIASFGFDSTADLVLNQQVPLQKEGPDVGLTVLDGGMYCFSLDMADESAPLLRVTVDHLDAVTGESVMPVENGFEHFLNSKLPVTLEVGMTEMSIDSVLSLATGSIIELDRQVGESMDVYVGDELVAKGEVVIMPDNTFGARVVKVMPIAGEMEKSIFQTAGDDL